MKIAIIVGAQRVESQSARVAEALKNMLDAGIETYTLDLGKNPLPLWDEGVWSKDEKWQKLWGPISAELQSSDALLVVSPEYHGMVPPALKNFFMLAVDGSIAHKPALAVGVSASRGGAYPIAELRLNASKNTSVTIIPEHLIVRDVNTTFHGDEPANDGDKYIRARGAYALNLLVEYAKALKLVRDSGVVDRKTYANGM